MRKASSHARASIVARKADPQLKILEMASAGFHLDGT